MNSLDDLKSSFARKLDERAAASKTRLDANLAALREALLRTAAPSLPADIARRLQGADEKLRAIGHQAPVAGHPLSAQPLLNLGGSAPLRELDAAFVEIFNLADYYPTGALDYPTVYCESLAEFFTPLVEGLNLSPQARQNELARLIAEAEETARQSGGGGIFGYNLPGTGCYLNGWLFVYDRGLGPRAALEQPDLLARVLGTAAHEKLGHGFLSAYSALGRVKSELGITLLETARRFGLRPADDPVEGLRRAQAELLGMASQLVEEGWATWVETFLGAAWMGPGSHPRHSLNAIVKAVGDLPVGMPDRNEVQAALVGTLETLFGEKDVSLPALHQAVMVIEVLGSELDTYFGTALGQPLRYAVGELLMTQVEANLGQLCVPYAALIAANIHFNPAQISLNDLREMLASQPGLNPDARLAALSRLKLDSPGDIAELARRAEMELSFSVPSQLKKEL